MDDALRKAQNFAREGDHDRARTMALLSIAESLQAIAVNLAVVVDEADARLRVESIDR